MMRTNHFDIRLRGILRRLLLAVATACIILPAAAKETGIQLYQLCVWLQGGQKTTYLSTDEPGISPAGDNIRLTTRALSFDIPRADILYFTMEPFDPNAPTAINLPPTLEMTTRLRDVPRLDYMLTPAEAVTTVTWASSNPGVVTVAADGTLTPVAPGEATVTAQTANGLTAECSVSVTAAHLKLFIRGVDQRGHEWCLGYDFDEQPTIESRGTNLVLITNSAAILYPRSEVEYFSLEDVATGDVYTRIGDLPAAESASPGFRAGDLTFNQLRADERVCVYDASGRLAAQATAGADGSLRLPTQPLPPGIYVIKTEHSTFKIQKQ